MDPVPPGHRWLSVTPWRPVRSVRCAAFTADFGFRHEGDPDDRHLSPALGGGALLDKGVYPVSFAFHLLGPPTTVAAHGRIGPTDVDTHLGALLGQDQRGGDPVELVAGSAVAARRPDHRDPGMDRRGAAVLVHGPVHGPAARRATRRADIRGGVAGPRGPTTWRSGSRGGHRESDVMPLDESVAIMAALDEIAAQIREAAGVTRPNLVLFMPDQLRADAVGCFGSPVERDASPGCLGRPRRALRRRLVAALGVRPEPGLDVHRLVSPHRRAPHARQPSRSRGNPTCSPCCATWGTTSPWRATGVTRSPPA